MNENAIKNLSLTRARGAFACALALALVAAVLVPLAVFGAAASPDAPPKAAAKAPAKAPAKADPAAADLKSADRNKRRAGVEKVLYGKGAARHDELAGALAKETDRDVKLKLMRAVANKGDLEAGVVGTLVDVLEWDTDPLARVAAAQELGRLQGGGSAEASLAEALRHDPDAAVREACAAALIFYSGEAGTAALAEAAAGTGPAAGMARLAIERRRSRGAR